MQMLTPGLAAVNVQSILTDLPHRPVDLFIYVLLAASVVLFWHVGRSRPEESKPDGRSD